MFNQGALMLESVTLAQMVEFMIEMLVYFASGAILDKKAAKNS